MVLGSRCKPFWYPIPKDECIEYVRARMLRPVRAHWVPVDKLEASAGVDHHVEDGMHRPLEHPRHLARRTSELLLRSRGTLKRGRPPGQPLPGLASRPLSRP